MSHLKDTQISTKCVHAGQEPEILYGCVNVPIYTSTTYAQTAPAEPFGPFDYSRCGNPTRNNLERSLAFLENGKYGLVWGSGMASINGVIETFCNVGDEVVCIEDVYGGTQRLFRQCMIPRNGIVFKFINFDDIEKSMKEINEKTKLIWIEVATNPTLAVADLEEITKKVKEINKNVIICADNTFMSPVNCTPLDFGVDIVSESITKYINGHSDVVMGLTVTNNKDYNDKMYFYSKSSGGVPSPFDCYLVLRGIRTLGIRMKTINNNAMAVAEFLEKNENVKKVMYPGLESNKYHNIAKKQFKNGYGGIISFVMKGGMDDAVKFLQNLKIFTLAESLGGVETLLTYPFTQTHADVPEEIRIANGITESVLRMSTGIEAKEDLIRDLKEAIDSYDGYKGQYI
jgi:cystathionine beta-lyase/cystathionine gamma-synthase